MSIKDLERHNKERERMNNLWILYRDYLNRKDKTEVESIGSFLNWIDNHAGVSKDDFHYLG